MVNFRLGTFFLLALLAYVLLISWVVRNARKNTPLNWNHGIVDGVDMVDPFYDVEAIKAARHGGHGGGHGMPHDDHGTDHDIHGDEIHKTTRPGEERHGTGEPDPQPATPRHMQGGGQGTRPTTPPANSH